MSDSVIAHTNSFDNGVRQNNGSKPHRTDLPAQAVFGSVELSGAPMAVKKGGEIYGQNEPADYVYKLLKGTAQSSKMLSDGRRQIQDFYFSGDVFGMESGLVHEAYAEAVTDVTLLVVHSSSVAVAAARDAAVASHVLAYLALELDHARNHATLLVKTAEERLASFLIQLDRRFTGDVVQLPMSRQDIADYLGLTVETVSRTFTLFETAGTIKLASARTIILNDRQALENLDE